MSEQNLPAENPAQAHASGHDPNPKQDPRSETIVTNVEEKKALEPENRIQIPIRIENEPIEKRMDSGSGQPGNRGPELVTESPASVNQGPVENTSQFNIKETMASVKDVLWTWGKKVGEATKKAEDFAGNTWQHLNTGPSFADAAMGRIAQGAKVVAEGGYEKIFRQTFETAPEEQLQNTYACYLSTSAGPVMGTLYLSTAKLAYCSDGPLPYKADDRTEWSYYKVVIPLHQLKAVNPSTSRVKPTEKYIQVISIDNHEFWFMGFLDYEGAVATLQDALQRQGLESV